MKTVWKITIPVDDEWHLVAGNPVHVASQYDSTSVQVWFETPVEPFKPLEVRVFGTGHHLPDDLEHVGTAVADPFVWHVYSRKP